MQHKEHDWLVTLGLVVVTLLAILDHDHRIIAVAGLIVNLLWVWT
jgi:hypothetical protein